MNLKSSKYNIFITLEKGVLGYNTLSDSFVYLPKEEYEWIFLNIDKPDMDSYFLSINGKKLISGGFFVSEKKDEYQDLCDEYRKNATHSTLYNLTILPSLDCNLRCWYCFEKHLVGSHLPLEVQNRIFLHIQSVFEKQRDLTHLSVELFGGEPLLYFKDEVYPLLKKIKLFIEGLGKTVAFLCVTNGVCITDELIPLFDELNMCFQVSIDGYKDKHDKVKYIPETKEGTYEHVIVAINKIIQNVRATFINLRINYDEQTLPHVGKLIKDISSIDRRKIRIHLERVWQTGNKRDSHNVVLKNLIDFLLKNGFDVSYMNLYRRSHSCKASKQRQSVISYDGQVYKCSGRDFASILSEGCLNRDGSISWDAEKLNNRLGINTYDNEMCKACLFLPQCWGPCCQKQLESKGSGLANYCQLNLMEMSLDDFVKYKFNKAYVAKQYEMPK